MLELRAAYWAEKFIDYQGYCNLVNRMPWTDDNYITYFPGGFEYDAEVSALEMMNTWDYLQGNQDQLQLKDMPVSPERNILLELAQSFLESGAIEIRVQKTEQGEYFLREPQIVDREIFEFVVSSSRCY
jgi:hypothetical protein